MFDYEQDDRLFQIAYSFDDVLLIPKKSEVISRKEIDIGSSLGNQNYKLPIISSPMDTVTTAEMASAMHNHGGLGIIHRYNTVEEQVDLVQRSISLGVSSPAAAIGVSRDFEERSHALYSSGVRIICVDVAHGHHINVERALKTVKDLFGSSVTLIAGNVATPEGFTDLQSWGADAIRVGIGGGSICSTRLQTGHGIPTFQSVLACKFRKENAKLIADGGIRNAGDIVKSIAAGADFVMLGSLLSGTTQSPGAAFEGKNGKSYKVYRGMASRQAQEAWRGHASSLEGISTTVPYQGSVEPILADLAQNIRSGFSYSGALTQDDFRDKSTFIRQSASSVTESTTHILSR